ncbi:hypothetical protein [Mycolicibacterium phlei]|jgi:hypothetical protein
MTERNATAESPQRPTTTATEPVLITEQQVHLATAAALAPAPRWRRGWANPLAGVSRALARLNQPKHPNYPKRRPFMEDALLAREMDRL